MNIDSNLSAVMQQVNFLMNSVKNLGQDMNQKTRIKFVRSYILSRIYYGLPVYIGE